MCSLKPESDCVNSLLSKLVALTHERDEAALEVALIKTLGDFIQASFDDQSDVVGIYHLKTVEEEQVVTRVSILKATQKISDENLLSVVQACFQTGEIRTYHNADEGGIKFYPLKNAANQIVSLIGIAAEFTDSKLDASINMLLQIYQNFTALINDNMYDTLTGLLNRKTFDHRMHKILTQMQNASKRSEDKPNQEYYLAVFDIDKFKRINDQYGHLIGDEVLLLFAQLMHQTYRETDPLFRFGGEEFVGVFECHNSNDIRLLLERFRKKVADFGFPQVGNVTVSIGYSKISAFDQPTQLVGRADSALYYAKNNGRNRIDSYEDLVLAGELQDSSKQGDIELF